MYSLNYNSLHTVNSEQNRPKTFTACSDLWALLHLVLVDDLVMRMLIAINLD